MAKENNSKRRNALGRGLSALLSDSENAQEDRLAPTLGNIAEIPVEAIETNPFQPRTHFDLEALEELKESILEQGIIQPITVRKLSDESYQLISGERRFQASKLAGLPKIPAYIRTADDEQMLEMALIENIQRQDLNPIEVALAYQRMVDELGLKFEDLGKKVGKKRATVNNYLRLLKLPPEIQVGLRDKKLSMGHARALISIEDPIMQLQLYKQILAEELSVRKVEEKVRALQQPKKEKHASPKASPAQIQLQSVADGLEDKLGNRVTIRQKPAGSGEIKIQFDSTEDLNRMLAILDV